MKFKPFSTKYDYASATLSEEFLEYMVEPIASWLYETLRYTATIETPYSGSPYLEQSFKHTLNIKFREVFPSDWAEFLQFIFRTKDRTCDILALVLQNYSNSESAESLEYILSESGSAYKVVKVIKDADRYTKGVYDLMQRVPRSIEAVSAKSLEDNALLMEAWRACYGRNPDYEKTVSRSCDFLEGFLGKTYFPKDPKPQLKKFVYALKEKTNASKMNYKGNGLVLPVNTITDLLESASDVRGQHTEGKGRKPNKEEAEFILHTTIYVWNLHQK